jgi:hypothetical protein
VEQKDYYVFVREHLLSGWVQDDTIWSTHNEAKDAAEEIYKTRKDFFSTLAVCVAVSENGGFPHAYYTLENGREKSSDGEQFSNGVFAHFYREAKRLGKNEISEELAKQIKRFKQAIFEYARSLNCRIEDPRVMKKMTYERAFIIGLTEVLTSRSET